MMSVDDSERHQQHLLVSDISFMSFQQVAEPALPLKQGVKSRSVQNHGWDCLAMAQGEIDFMSE